MLSDRAVEPAGRAVFGLSLLAVGVGSFLGHADATDWGRELDSLAIKLMLIAFVLFPLFRLRSWSPAALSATWVGTAVTVIAIQLLVPSSANVILVLLSAGGLVLVWQAARAATLRWLGAGLGLLGAGALLWWLGRDGGPWCSAEASLQPHGLWHILAAAGIACLYEVHRSNMP
jgi:hypothetical protein